MELLDEREIIEKEKLVVCSIKQQMPFKVIENWELASLILLYIITGTIFEWLYYWWKHRFWESTGKVIWLLHFFIRHLKTLLKGNHHHLY